MCVLEDALVWHQVVLEPLADREEGGDHGREECKGRDGDQVRRADEEAGRWRQHVDWLILTSSTGCRVLDSKDSRDDEHTHQAAQAGYLERVDRYLGGIWAKLAPLPCCWIASAMRRSMAGLRAMDFMKAKVFP
ncbi:hypothetical protein ABZP36_013557 [Zizania latifolia]